jgi:very-short-patch-repair endonuclease
VVVKKREKFESIFDSGEFIMNTSRQTIWEINKPFEALWKDSGVESAYLELAKDRIYELVRNLNAYDPEIMHFSEYKASIEMLAYTTTELLAQLCSGGFRWNTSDKARFLSPTVNLESIVRSWAKNYESYPNLVRYYNEIEKGIWSFLSVSEETHAWFETISLSQAQLSYLLWSAQKALSLLRADERINGFTSLCLNNPNVLDGFAKCESPIESILFMQLTVDGLLPPEILSQYQIGKFRVDFSIPEKQMVIECDGAKYHDAQRDNERDSVLNDAGWMVIRFSATEIMNDPESCSMRLHQIYPWENYPRF